MTSLTPFEIFLDVFTTAIEAPVMAYFTGKAIKTNRLKLCIFAYTILMTVEYMVFRSMPQYSWIVLLILSLCFFGTFSNVPKWQTVLFYIMGIILMMLFETGIEVIESFYLRSLHVQIRADIMNVVGMRLVIEPLLIFVWYLNSKIWNRFFRLGESKEFDRYIPFIIIEAASLYVMYLNIIATDIEKRVYPEILMIVALGAFLLIDILLIHTFRRIDYLHKKEIQERTAREILQVQMDTYKFQNKANREFRKIRHDLVNHLQTIYLFLEKKEIDKAKDILRNYSEEVKLSAINNITGNEFADMVINKKMERTAKEGISFHIDGTLANNLAINPASFCSLIENMLDNAINGCMNSQKEPREIFLKIAADQDKLMIRCSNTCHDESTKPTGIKREKGDHGWGTQIIESIVTKYGGAVDYQVENGIFITTAYCFLRQETRDEAND